MRYLKKEQKNIINIENPYQIAIKKIYVTLQKRKNLNIVNIVVKNFIRELIHIVRKNVFIKHVEVNDHQKMNSWRSLRS